MDLRLDTTHMHQPIAGTTNAQAAQTGQEFEAFFVYHMLELMDTGTPETFGGGFAEDTFRQLRNEYIADALTARGTGLGIADSVERELLRIQAELPLAGTQPRSR